MADFKQSFKLIMGGNTNIPAMINAIIRATIQLRSNTENNSITFSQVHIFHTEQSIQSLMKDTKPWHQALTYYNILTTSLIHHVAKLEDSNIDRFKDMVEQLRTIVSPTENTYYYVDLTGGISSLQAILAVFSYVLDIENIYTLETRFSNDNDIRIKQKGLFYHELEQEIINKTIEINYRKFPPIRDFDEFGKLNYTEVLRHRKTITNLTEKLTDSLSSLISSEYDLNHLQASFLSGIDSRLRGEVTENYYNYQNSVYSFSIGIEEITNTIISALTGGEIENKMLGYKLEDMRNFFADKPKYFVNKDILEHFTKLMLAIRNDIAHPNNQSEKNDIIEIQSYLSAHLAFTFLRFTIKTLSAFLDQHGNMLNIEEFIEPPLNEEAMVFYFGFDGDKTGKYLEEAFGDFNEDESEVKRRSKQISKALKDIRTIICSETQDNTSVIFAEGDDILFKAQYKKPLLNKIQKKYREITGLNSSIGYGKTLREATIAMRLSKAKKGDSIVGVNIKQ